MLKAVGFTDEDLAKPLVGVATTWIETMPCNFNQRALAQKVKQGIREAGGTPVQLQHDLGLRRRDDGRRGHARARSLVSREVIADSIGSWTRSHLPRRCSSAWSAATRRSRPLGMALARMDIPGLVFYNGSIAPGRSAGAT